MADGHLDDRPTRRSNSSSREKSSFASQRGPAWFSWRAVEQPSSPSRLFDRFLEFAEKLEELLRLPAIPLFLIAVSGQRTNRLKLR
jgi:hypothetical protein